MNTLVSGRYAPSVPSAPAAPGTGLADLKQFLARLAYNYQETRSRVEAHYRTLAEAKQLRREMRMLGGQ
jgi:hypothetical protein